jgi:hypothetical protein
MDVDRPRSHWETEAEFSSFVAARSHALLRTAYLLTGTAATRRPCSRPRWAGRTSRGTASPTQFAADDSTCDARVDGIDPEDGEPAGPTTYECEAD